MDDHYYGLDIEIVGLSDKIGMVLSTVIETIINLKPEEEEVVAAKEEIK